MWIQQYLTTTIGTWSCKTCASSERVKNLTEKLFFGLLAVDVIRVKKSTCLSHHGLQYHQRCHRRVHFCCVWWGPNTTMLLTMCTHLWQLDLPKSARCIAVDGHDFLPRSLSSRQSWGIDSGVEFADCDSRTVRLQHNVLSLLFDAILYVWLLIAPDTYMLHGCRFFEQLSALRVLSLDVNSLTILNADDFVSLTLLETVCSPPVYSRDILRIYFAYA